VQHGVQGIIITGFADVETCVRAMRAGSLDLLQKPVNREQLLESVTRSLSDSRFAREARFAEWQARHTHGFSEILGESAAIRRTLDLVRKVIPTSAAVLIQGESGTGKELIARAIHAEGPRAQFPYIAFNSASISSTLMESTLFGHKKGAFTDARADRPGLFEAAHHGTLFLDEIGDATPEVQVRLLRVLQEKSIIRVGDVRPISVDVRIVAATNRNLKREMEEHRFRPELFYRLSVLCIDIPPLRDREDDVVLLAARFLVKYALEYGKAACDFSAQALQKLRRYHWPGNIRELENVVARAVLLSDTQEIGSELLLLNPEDDRSDAGGWSNIPFREAQARFERIYFSNLLRRYGGNKSRAAEAAELDRTSLHGHLHKLNREEKE
jgi:DNA-binding NtrC family response regulator